MDDESNIDGSGSGEGGITGVLKFAYESTLKDYRWIRNIALDR